MEQRQMTEEVLKLQQERLMKESRGFNFPFNQDKMKYFIYHYYRSAVERRKNKLILTDNLKNQICQVAEFLTEETRRYGLYINGDVGNGKSTMARAIRNTINYLIEANFIKATENTEGRYCCLFKGMDLIDLYTDKNLFRKVISTKYLVLDDIGEEPMEVNMYGTAFHPFMELLDYRYEHMLPTVIVSNLSPLDLKEKYHDNRVSDRMREMFKVISFDDKSFR